jgi:hypothetical protein
VFSAAQHHTHFADPRNFSEVTEIRCFDSDGRTSSE